MYGIFAQMWHTFMVNVGTYWIHGSCGIWHEFRFFFSCESSRSFCRFFVQSNMLDDQASAILGKLEGWHVAPTIYENN